MTKLQDNEISTSNAVPMRELRRGVLGRIAALEVLSASGCVVGVGGSAMLFGSVLCGAPVSGVPFGDAFGAIP